jgi:hypothetical protein
MIAIRPNMSKAATAEMTVATIIRVVRLVSPLPISSLDKDAVLEGADTVGDMTMDAAVEAEASMLEPGVTTDVDKGAGNVVGAAGEINGVVSKPPAVEGVIMLGIEDTASQLRLQTAN